MANMTKEQELNVLLQMQKIQERLQKLWDEEMALSEKKEDISRVKKADFPTDHLKKAEAEKEKELDIVQGAGLIGSLLLGAVLGIPCAFTFGFVITDTRVRLQIDHSGVQIGALQVLKIRLGVKFRQKAFVPILDMHIAQMAAVGVFKPHKSTSDNRFQQKYSTRRGKCKGKWAKK